MDLTTMFVSQRKLRAPEQTYTLVDSVLNGEPIKPVLLSEDDDGSIQVEDGHHRVVAYWLAGRLRLRSEEYVLILRERLRPRFGRIPDLISRVQATSVQLPEPRRITPPFSDRRDRGRLACHARSMRCLVAVGVMLAMTSSVHAESEVRTILDRAIKNERDRKVLDESLAAIDQLLAKNTKDPEAHYARGWVLSRLERPAEAVAEYDQALAIDPKFADAAYNAGVVLGGLKREKEAVAYFDKALAIDPKFADAAYNAGQGYYNLKDFARAAERWIAAEKQAPEDFAVAKKLVQAYHALHKDAEAARARDKVFALHKAGKAGRAKDFVFDQFDVGNHHIYASETFDTSGDLAYVYRFDVADNDRGIGSVNLETSAVIREQGLPYLLGMDKGGTHSQLGKTFRTLPTYKALKPLVIDAIKAKF
jgi:tetratricopeptide (TPR) repeat protein